jgi:hypothetical protein
MDTFANFATVRMSILPGFSAAGGLPLFPACFAMNTLPIKMRFQNTPVNPR